MGALLEEALLQIQLSEDVSVKGNAVSKMKNTCTILVDQSIVFDWMQASRGFITAKGIYSKFITK